MIILIPPSEGKQKNNLNNVLFEDTNFIFQNQVKQIIELLETVDTRSLTSLYGTSQEKSEILHRQNKDILKSYCANAIERYTGVVYKYINWETLSQISKDYMQKHIRIFSGFFGMLTPLTMIPNYKLKMNVLSLHKHWKPILTKELQDEELILDLLPQVHRKAYSSNKNVIPIDFIIIKNGKKTTAGHLGKAVKGKFIRFLAINRIANINQFDKFNEDGFVWDGSQFIKNITE